MDKITPNLNWDREEEYVTTELRGKKQYETVQADKHSEVYSLNSDGKAYKLERVRKEKIRRGNQPVSCFRRGSLDSSHELCISENFTLKEKKRNNRFSSVVVGKEARDLFARVDSVAREKVNSLLEKLEGLDSNRWDAKRIIDAPISEYDGLPIIAIDYSGYLVELAGQKIALVRESVLDTESEDWREKVDKPAKSDYFLRFQKTQNQKILDSGSAVLVKSTEGIMPQEHNKELINLFNAIAEKAGTQRPVVVEGHQIPGICAYEEVYTL